MNGKNLKYFVMGAAIVAAGLGAFAITLPAAFTSGEVLTAAKLNDYFTRIKNAIDALEADGSVSTAKLADGAVTTAKLADGAVNAAKTADEAGFNTISAFPESAVAITSTPTGVTNITLSAPAAGFAVVTANFVWTANHTNTAQSVATFSLSKTAGVMGNLANRQLVSLPAALPSGSYSQSVALSEVFTVTAGNTTFHLNAESSASGQLMGRTKMTVIYLPTRYGTGATVN